MSTRADLPLVRPVEEADRLAADRPHAAGPRARLRRFAKIDRTSPDMPDCSPGTGREHPAHLIEGFQGRARGVGLTEPAEQLAVFHRLPETAQKAAWRDLADQIDRERIDPGLVG